MFTDFDFGITPAQIMAEVTALLGNSLIVAIAAGAIALLLAPNLIAFARGAARGFQNARFDIAENVLHRHFGDPEDPDEGYGYGSTWHERLYSRLTDTEYHLRD
jgi:hypothetical protein